MARKRPATTNRKLWFAVGTSVAIVGLTGLAGMHPAIAVVFPAAVSALLGSLTLYITGNVGHHHVTLNGKGVPEEPCEPEVKV